MAQPGAPPPAWEYYTLTLAYGEAPEYAALGKEGWELVSVYDDAVPPAPTGRNLDGAFDARTYVFKRPVPNVA